MYMYMHDMLHPMCPRNHIIIILRDPFSPCMSVGSGNGTMKVAPGILWSISLGINKCTLMLEMNGKLKNDCCTRLDLF